MGYTQEQLEFIKEMRENGLTWDEVTEHYNHAFEDNKTTVDEINMIPFIPTLGFSIHF